MVKTIAAALLGLQQLLPAAAQAEDSTVQISASYNVQAPIAGTTESDLVAQEHRLKRAMYERGARECAELLATIARSCAITGINVSTQINQTYGQPQTIYLNSNVNMQVTLK